MLKLDMVREATRLARSGQLVEATALLQRMLRGENGPDVAAPSAHRSIPTRRAADHRRQGKCCREDLVRFARSVRRWISPRTSTGSDSEDR